MNKNLFLIHGAWCTKESFNYVIKKVLDDSPVGNIHGFSYDCQKEGIHKIAERAKKELSAISQNGLKTVVVGHSMGGLVALNLSQYQHVHKTITLASPLNGLKYDRILHMLLLYHAPILKDILTDSKFVRKTHSLDYSHRPVEVHITTKGFNPMIYEPNDGVVTQAAQRAWAPPGAVIMEDPHNHSEVLQSPLTIFSIEKALTE